MFSNNDVIMSTPCDSCAQMDNKLRKFEEEVSSLKLIIDLLRTECKVTKQVSQDDLIVNTATKVNSDTNLSTQPNVMHVPYETSSIEHYAVPTSNRYAVMSGYTEPTHCSLSSQTHRDNVMRYSSRMTSKHKFKAKTLLVPRKEMNLGFKLLIVVTLFKSLRLIVMQYPQ